MTDTQDDCRRAFERWYNDFPVGGRAAKEGLAWTVWQAAWSTRPQPNVEELVREIEVKRDFICINGRNQWQNGYHRGNTDAVALIRKWANKGEL